MRVLIAGCGYVGQCLARLLLADGDQVWAWSLSARPRSAVEHRQCDLRDAVAVRDALASPSAEPDAVCFLASPPRGDDAAYRSTYVDALANLLGALPHPKQTRLLLASSTAVYGQRDGAWVNEESPTVPAGFAGRRLIEAEQLARHRCPRSVVVRFGGIYGPGRTRLASEIAAGRAIVRPDQWRCGNRIHRDDCAGLLRQLIHDAEPAPLYLGVDDDPADSRCVQRWLCQRLGVDPAALAAPTKLPVGRASHKRCSNERLRAAGYQLRYPTFREGYGVLLGDDTGRAQGLPSAVDPR